MSGRSTTDWWMNPPWWKRLYYKSLCLVPGRRKALKAKMDAAWTAAVKASAGTNYTIPISTDSELYKEMVRLGYYKEVKT